MCCENTEYWRQQIQIGWKDIFTKIITQKDTCQQKLSNRGPEALYAMISVGAKTKYKYASVFFLHGLTHIEAE